MRNGMDISDLPRTVLFFFLIGLLLACGVLILGKFGIQAMDTTTYVDTGKNLSTGTSMALTQTNCIKVTSIDNGTTTFNLVTYNVSMGVLSTCTLSYSPIAACALPKCNVTYTYGAANDASTATSNAVSAITPIASSWMPLIITVIVLSIILGLVISSFSGGRK